MDAIQKQKLTQAYTDDPQLEERARIFMKAVMERAKTDWDFRQQLLNDPQQALADFAGVENASPDFRIAFVENNADATLVLPDPVEMDAELSAEELEAVAGGELAVAASVLAVVGSCLAVYDAWFD